MDKLSAALNGSGPMFIHAPIDGDARVYPMVPHGAGNHEMIAGTTTPMTTESRGGIPIGVIREH